MTDKFWQTDRPSTPEQEEQFARYRQRVQSIADVLGLPLDHCDEEIERALENIAEAASDAANYALFTKDTKRNLTTLLSALRKASAAYAKLPELMHGPIFPELDLKLHIEICDMYSRWALNKKNKRPPALAQQEAAWEARKLLRAFGQQVTVHREGKWCRLAALLYGEPDKDLSHYCRNLKP